MIEKEEKRKGVLDEKEKKLQKDEEKTMKQEEALQRMLKDAQVKMDVAIKENGMLGVTVAKEMLTAANEKQRQKSPKKLGKREKRKLKTLLRM